MLRRQSSTIVLDVKQFSILPKMIVFDLDYTLWPLWIEMYSDPFNIDRYTARDKGNRIVNPFPEVKEILKELDNAGIIIGIASRTTAVKPARLLIDALGWGPFIKYEEIFPGCKTTHFENLCKSSKIPLKHMLFFDDEERNIRDVSAIGVVCQLVDEYGMNKFTLMNGLLKFSKERAPVQE